VHDFGGFDPALYQLRYPAPGHPQLAREAIEALTAAGFHALADAGRGLDHGAWVPLWHMRPSADLPVFQVSLPPALDTAGAVRLGRALAPLRELGVVIVGSGSMTHNLYEFRQSALGSASYAREFAAWTRRVVEQREMERLVAYRQLAPHARRAHPTEEHFLPLLVAMGASDAAEPAHVIEGGITHGVLAMDSYAWGLASAHGPQSRESTMATG
jgi:4,5-DOPA dioxygenase extradiol